MYGVDVVRPLIETFGIWFVVGTWLFVPTTLSMLSLYSEMHTSIKIIGFIVPYLIWPISLWMLKWIYNFIPIRFVFGIDVTDLSTSMIIFLSVYVFLREVTEELTGGIEK